MRAIIIDEVDGIDGSIEINEVDEVGKKATVHIVETDRVTPLHARAIAAATAQGAVRLGN